MNKECGDALKAWLHYSFIILRFYHSEVVSFFRCRLTDFLSLSSLT